MKLKEREARIELPPKLLEVFANPRGSLRYRGAYGGRGSGKSMGFAKMAAVWGVVDSLRVVCTRDLQDSIKQSFHAELKAAIASEPWLAKAYDVGEDYLRSRINDTEFFFKGLRHNIGSIKSMAQIDLCIVEEAEDVPEYSWRALTPTIRAPKSEIWVIWNPRDEGSPVDKRFRGEKPAPRSHIVEMNFADNPWFPDVLEEERLDALERFEPEIYANVWEGKYLKASKAAVFYNKWINGFRDTTGWNGPYVGLDWGFSTDPTAAVRCWISPDERELYIDAEYTEVGLELDDTAKEVCKAIPEAAYLVVTADNARPESISHVQKPRRSSDEDDEALYSLPRIVACVKGAGSVEDGLDFLKTFTIVVHPGCSATRNELTEYKYKVDRLSGDVLRDLVDANNHLIDALRYAVESIMRSRSKSRVFSRKKAA